MSPNQENFYWLFSSSAQTISSFVAFLIAGFAVVLSMMDNLEKKDETLEEIHKKIKSKYYNKICWLAVLTAIAVLMNLLMVFLNGTSYDYKKLLYLFTAGLTIFTTIFGIYFILAIINPSKYQIAAKQLIKENTPDLKKTGVDVNQLQFMAEFIQLEKIIREILQTKGWYVGYGNTPKMAFSFRQMVESLLEHDVIDKQTFVRLIEINKYRNLVFHGHQETVDSGVLAELVKIAEKLNSYDKS